MMRGERRWRSGGAPARALQNVCPHGVLSGVLSTWPQRRQPNSFNRRCFSVISLRFLGWMDVGVASEG